MSRPIRRKRADDGTSAWPAAALTLPNETFKHSSHPVEVGDPLTDHGQLVLSEGACGRAALSVIELQKPANLLQRESEFLGPLDEAKPRHRLGTVSAD